MISDSHIAVTCIVMQHYFFYNEWEETRDLNYMTAIW